MRRVLLGLTALLTVVARSAAAEPVTFRTGQPVMGTVLQVTIVAADESQARDVANAAIDEGRRWDNLLTTWRTDGELATLNVHAGHGPTMISASLADALRRMLDLSRATGGIFDPGVGPLVSAWRGPRPPLPPPAATAATRIATALQLDGSHATLLAGAGLDAGGVGKGMALDAIGALLRERGVESALLDFGGSSQLAIGAPPGSPAGWPVLVAGLASGSVLGTLHLRDAALSTSRAATGPNPVGPIIDPRSGAPVFTPRLGTVRASDATTAEAWSKVAIIAAREALPAADAQQVQMVVEDSAGVATTPNFAFAD